MAVDYSPPAVERRLRRAFELSDLCRSLAAAGRRSRQAAVPAQPAPPDGSTREPLPGAHTDQRPPPPAGPGMKVEDVASVSSVRQKTGAARPEAPAASRQADG